MSWMSWLRLAGTYIADMEYSNDVILWKYLLEATSNLIFENNLSYNNITSLKILHFLFQIVTMSELMVCFPCIFPTLSSIVKGLQTVCSTHNHKLIQLITCLHYKFKDKIFFLKTFTSFTFICTAPINNQQTCPWILLKMYFVWFNLSKFGTN